MSGIESPVKMFTERMDLSMYVSQRNDDIMTVLLSTLNDADVAMLVTSSCEIGSAQSYSYTKYKNGRQRRMVALSFVPPNSSSPLSAKYFLCNAKVQNALKVGVFKSSNTRAIEAHRTVLNYMKQEGYLQ